MRRPGRGPPPIVSMTSRSGVPICTSATPCRRVAPVTVQTIVPGDSSVPSVRNQSAPRAMIRGTLAMVSTLLASVGGASLPPSVAISTAADRPLPDVASDTVSTTSVTPRRNGGAMRGKG